MAAEDAEEEEEEEKGVEREDSDKEETAGARVRVCAELAGCAARA